MNHTKECQQQIDEREAVRETWVKLWPNYCETCNGAGAHYYSYDPSPAGVALSPGSMMDVDSCPDCAEKGICSRCGEKVWDEDNIEYPCPKCGWDGKDQMPAEPECFCYFRDESAAGWEDLQDGGDEDPAF